MPKGCVVLSRCLSSLLNVTSARSELLNRCSDHGIFCSNVLVFKRNLTELQLRGETLLGSWRTGRIKQSPEFTLLWHSDVGQTSSSGSAIDMEMQRQGQVFRKCWHRRYLVLFKARENLPNDLNTGLSPRPLQLGYIQLLLLAAGIFFLSRQRSFRPSRGMVILVHNPKLHAERSSDWKWRIVEKPSSLAQLAAGHPLTLPYP